MLKIKKTIIKLVQANKIGKKIQADNYFIITREKSGSEIQKRPRRTEIINFLIELNSGQNYLEIGVRDPKKNFDRIKCKTKFSVDPGIEFQENPVDYKMTSDVFFENLNSGKLDISSEIKFDAIFIDGLHKANQVDNDISNSLQHLKQDGFIILHDCNPPTEFHQRESYEFMNSPAGPFWNGTTWKAFYKYRHNTELFSICFDSDWGVAVLSKKKYSRFNNIKGSIKNEFYEFSILEKNKKDNLNLISFESWKKIIKNK